MSVRDVFSDEQLLHINTVTPWFADIFNIVSASQFPPEASRPYKERLKSDAKCIPNAEIKLVLQFCHATFGCSHYGSTQTLEKSMITGSIDPPFSKTLINSSPPTKNKPQTNDQAEVFNREIKKTLQKMANPSQKNWSRLLEDALWAHKTAYRTPLGMSPYQIVFGKAYHLLVEDRAYWAVK
ncbi:hypothetical protein CR513_03676, partial [Mucuna pruriens]